MKFLFLHLATAQESWAEQAEELYEKKIAHFVDFEVKGLKPTKASRQHRDAKVGEESARVLEFLEKDDLLVLFDERGKTLDSCKFSDWLQKVRESGKRRVVFVIGGAYGFSDELRARAQHQIGLAPFVLNHLVAKTVALEQIYRALTIQKGLPYHNE